MHFLELQWNRIEQKLDAMLALELHNHHLLHALARKIDPPGLAELHSEAAKLKTVTDALKTSLKENTNAKS